MTRQTGAQWRGIAWGAVLVTALVSPAHAEPDFAAGSEEMVVLLRQAIRIDSSNPPGHTDAMAALYAGALRDVAVEPTLMESEPGQVHVLARLKGDGSARPLLLLNHMDVVGAEAAEWDHPPFGATVVDDVLYGRGALDMKGLGVLQLQVMRELARAGVPLRRDVIFYAAPDEEAGGPRGAEWMVTHHWSKVDAEFVLSEGGSGRRDAFGQGSRVFFVQTAEKGVCWLKMTARGTSGHGSRPTPDNPNLYLVRALSRITDYATPVRLVPTVAKALAQLAPVVGGEQGKLWARAADPAALAEIVPSLLGHEMFNPISRTTINLTNLDAGYKANVVPATASAILDCRILPGETPADLLALLTRLAHDPEAAAFDARRAAELGRPLTAGESRQVSFEFIVQGNATESSIDSPAYRAIEAVLRTLHPGAPLVPLMSAGGTDSRFWRQHGRDAYGFAPFMLTAAQRHTVHGKNEHIDLGDYRAALEPYYEIVRRIATAAP